MKKKSIGTYKIAEICGVTPSTIGRWIKDGKIPFFRTAGGQSKVWVRDLVPFLKTHNIPVPPEMTPEPEEAPKILIVDDEPEVRTLVSRIVRRTFPEADVHDAGDGFDAGQKVADLQPALIILDLRLPGMDGFRVCQSIRQDDRFRKTRILAMTGYGVDDSRKRVLSLGADDFIAKPFSTTEMSDKMKKLLGDAE
ncbi:MAG: response regulator [Elusimicrobia bacterium]|nr:response regulator [Elusimicrobiota bacterium]